MHMVIFGDTVTVTPPQKAINLPATETVAHVTANGKQVSQLEKYRQSPSSQWEMRRLCNEFCGDSQLQPSPLSVSYIEQPVPGHHIDYLEASMSPGMHANMENASPNGSNAVVSLSQAEVEDFRDAFRLFDIENKGVISLRELRMVLESVVQESQVPARSSTMGRVLAVMKPLPDDQTLTQDDFIALLTTPDPNDKRDEMQRVFDMFDVENKGYINQNDLRKVAIELGETMADEEIDEMVQRVASADGKVTFEEFSDIMTRQLFS